MKIVRWVIFWIALILCWYLYWPAQLLAEPRSISMRLTPQTCMPPCTVRYSVIVHRHPDNLRFSIAWGGHLGHEGYHEMPHEGENAPYQIVGLLKDLPQGVYGVQACVYRAKGKRCTEVQTLYVGETPEDDDAVEKKRKGLP